MPKAEKPPMLQKLNPIRVGLTKDLKQLRSYRYSGEKIAKENQYLLLDDINL